MITLSNLYQIQMMGDACARPINFRSTSTLAKLLSRIPPEVDDIYKLVEAVNADAGHEAIMAELATEMSANLLARIAFIRNTVSSTVEEIVAEVEANAALVPQMYLPVTVASSTIPSLLRDEFMATFTAQYRDSRLETINPPATKFPLYAADELAQKMIFIPEDRDLLHGVHDLLASCETSVVDIYNKWFRGITTKNYPVATQMIAPAYVPFMYIEWTVVFLLAQGFYKNVDPNVNMRISDYNTFLLNVIGNTGKYLTNSMAALKDQVGVDAPLVLGRIVKNGTTIIVMNHYRYTEALNAGTIDPVHVMGMELLGRVTELNNSVGEDIKDAAKRKYDGTLAKYQAIGLERYKGALVSEVNRSLLKRVQSGNYCIAGEASSSIMQRCKDLLDEYGVLGSDHLFQFVRSVVCKGLFPHSGAFAYFNAMDSYQKINPDIDAREAASLAASDVLVEFCINQISGIK